MNEAERIAREFHYTYERLAPAYGYETRAETQTAWTHLPDANRRLMIATARDLIGRGIIRAGGQKAARE